MYEPKWDGHRVIVRKRGERIEAISSNGIDRTARWPWLSDAVRTAIAADVILDGEIIALDDDGHHSFQLVGRPDRPHAFVVFDVLAIDGKELYSMPWQDRRTLLDERVTPTPPLSITPVTDDADALMEATMANGFEGIIAKRTDSTYLPGRRTPSWIKVKHRREQEVVIGGYLLGEGNRSTSFGSLLVGVYERKKLRFAGAVGTGFNEATLRMLQARSPNCTPTPARSTLSRSCPARPDGCAPSWSPKSRSANGPKPAACATPSTSASATTNPHQGDQRTRLTERRVDTG